MFNIGYLEAKKDYPYDCIVFHDVDLIMENDRNLYKCRNRPMQLSSLISGQNYTINWAMFGRFDGNERNSLMETKENSSSGKCS